MISAATAVKLRHWALIFGLAACNRTPSAPPHARASSSAVPAPSASAAPSAAAATPLAPPLPDGCWDEIDRDGDPATVLARLTRACAPGQRALAPAREVEVAPGARAELAFTVPDGGACVRSLAVAAKGSGDTRLALLDPDARSLEQDTLVAELALIGERGPVCLDPGRYRVRVESARGRAVWVSVVAPGSGEGP